MHANNGTLYPMLGVGAFMTMFWTGFVVGHELGLSCAPLLIMGLLFACAATVGVCELQRRDGQGLATGARERVPGHGGPVGNTDAREPARAGAEGSPPGAMSIGGRLPAGPC